MAIGSGLAGQLGFAKESVYGTYIAPDHFIESEDVSLQKVKNTVQGGGLAAGGLVDRGIHRVVTSRGASGSIRAEVKPRGFGLLLNHIFGGTGITPVLAVTPAYNLTFPLADNIGDSLTIQSGVPDLAGTVRSFSFLGCKVLDAEFTQAIDALLMLAVTFDGRDVDETRALSTAAYPATNNTPFHWAGFGIKIGTYGSEAAVQGVRGASFKVTRGQRVDRQYGNNAGLKAEPIMNAKTALTGSLDVDLVNKADFADRFASDGAFSMVLSWTGSLIGASGLPESLTITLPECRLDGATPMVTGYDIVTGSYPYSVLWNGVNAPATVVYVSADAAL